MRMREFIEWLAQFPDQDATVEVLECQTGAPYTQQGGVTSSVEFDPFSRRANPVASGPVGFQPAKHSEYTDLRGNPWIRDDAPYKDARTLLLGLNGG